jgi:hypothetical protein
MDCLDLPDLRSLIALSDAAGGESVIARTYLLRSVERCVVILFLCHVGTIKSMMSNNTDQRTKTKTTKSMTPLIEVE